MKTAVILFFLLTSVAAFCQKPVIEDTTKRMYMNVQVSSGMVMFQPELTPGATHSIGCGISLKLKKGWFSAMLKTTYGNALLYHSDKFLFDARFSYMAFNLPLTYTKVFHKINYSIGISYGLRNFLPESISYGGRDYVFVSANQNISSIYTGIVAVTKEFVVAPKQRLYTGIELNQLLPIAPQQLYVGTPDNKGYSNLLGSSLLLTTGLKF